MTVHVDPWDGGTTTGLEERIFLHRLFRSAGGVMESTSLAVAQNGTPNMTVVVGTGVAIVPWTSTAGNGSFRVENDASLSVSIPTEATLNRIDLIIAEVTVSGSTYSATIRKVAGTAASTPSAPAVPNNAIALAQVAVNAGASTIVTGNITDRRTQASTVQGVGAILADHLGAGSVIAGKLGTAAVLEANYGSGSFPPAAVKTGAQAWPWPRGLAKYVAMTSTQTVSSSSPTDVSALFATATIQASSFIEVQVGVTVQATTVGGVAVDATHPLEVRMEPYIVGVGIGNGSVYRHVHRGVDPEWSVGSGFWSGLAAGTYQFGVTTSSPHTSAVYDVQASSGRPCWIKVIDWGPIPA